MRVLELGRWRVVEVTGTSAGWRVGWVVGRVGKESVDVGIVVLEGSRWLLVSVAITGSELVNRDAPGRTRGAGYKMM
jgi:hypothetical protein